MPYYADANGEIQYAGVWREFPDGERYFWHPYNPNMEVDAPRLQPKESKSKLIKKAFKKAFAVLA